MLELHVSDKDATSGTVCLSWCVSKETLQELADKGVANPLLVICIAPAGSNYWIAKEHRQVVPLKDLMAYCELHCQGANQIRAFVSTGGRKETYGYLDKLEGKYSTHIISSGGDEWAHWIKGDASWQSRLSNVLLVDVPEECFAPEPWDKDWVNWLFKNQCIDQCDFRRRRFLAYTLQVPMMMFHLFFKLVVSTFALLCGSRGFSFKYLLHPLTYDWDSIMSNIFDGGTIFVRKLPDANDERTDWQEVWYLVRKLCLLPLMPVIWLPLLGLYRAHILWQAFAIVGGLALGICVIAMIATGTLTALYYGLLDKLTSSKMWYLDKEEQDFLVCGDKKAMKLSDLPVRRRTIKLRFYDLKSKVCRPFSR